MSGTPPLPTTVTGTMPSRSSSSAPKFDGSPQSLRRFLDEVRDLADEKKVSDKAAIKAALAYIPAADYPSWSALNAAAGDKWAEFTDAIYAIYPGTASTDRQYTKTDLALLIKRTQNEPMHDHNDFGQYYRSFFAITSFLMKKGRMGNAEQSTKLVEGLPPALQKELFQYLRAVEPSHHADDPWALTTLYDAILFVLSNINSTGTMSSHLSHHERSSSNQQVKTEVFDASSLDKYFESEAFMGKMSALMLRSQPRGNFNAAPQNTYPSSTPYAGAPPASTSYTGTPFTCLFCSDPNHLIRECPTAHQYIKEGRCARNELGKMVLPGNVFVSGCTMPGRNMKEQIDYWHNSNSSSSTGASTQASSGFLLQVAEHANPPCTSQGPLNEIAQLESGIAMNHARITALKLEASNYGPTTRTRSYGNDERPTKDTPPHMPAGTIVPTPTTNNAKTSPSTHTTTIPAAKPSAPITTAMVPAPPARSQPQFSYQAPVEDANAVNDVLERSLNTEVKVTNRQLLAMSNELRKAFREQTTAKRISNNLMAVSNEGAPPISSKSTLCCCPDT